MRFRIEFSAEAERGFARIFDHLFESYRSFGTRVGAALDDCEDRICDIRQVSVAARPLDRFPRVAM